MIAFGHLWTISTDGPPQRVAAVHPFSTGLSWSPSGREVVWSGGVEGTEDLFVTGMETGETRQLTALPGSEYRASWSPDGSSIAFVHYEKPALDIPPWSRGPYAQLRVVAATGEAIARADETLHLGEARLWDGSGEEGPTWSPNSDAVLVAVADTVDWPGSEARTPRIVSLEGVSTPITGLPKPATFPYWASDSTIVYVYDDRIYRAELSGPEVTRIELITEDAAVSPTVALDGSVLYRSSDGLRVRRPDGSVDILGWPIETEIPNAPEPTVFTNVRIFDAQTGVLGAVADILVEGGRIAEVGVSGSLGQGPRNRVVDAGGRIAIPGLIDLHIHGWHPSRVANDLYFGITTVRDAGSREARSAALRDAIDVQVIDGPRLVLGGPQFYPSEGPWTTDAGHGVTDLAGIGRTLDLAAGLGVQHAKLYVPGPLRLATVFVSEARERGMRITGHYASSLTLVAAGMDGKEHLGGPEGGHRLNRTWHDDMIQLFSKSGIGVTPTVEARRTFWFHGMFDDPEIARAIMPKVRLNALQQSPEQVSQVDFTQPTPRHDELRPLIGTDVLIGAGNDGYVPSALHWELEGLVLAGMSPAQALIAATSNAAQILGAEASIGAIEEGKLADIVLLDANPLEDIRNTRKIWMVIKGGRIIDREAMLESNRGPPETGG
jgi:imidazolonepropionase-like amidohydrolase